MARVLLGITGSVAAVRAPELYEALTASGHDVKVIATEAARCFFAEEQFSCAATSEQPALLSVRDQSVFYYDADEWPSQRLFRLGEPVLHIELRKWADVLLIAPLDANSLGKLAMGLCDNLLSCIYRAWDFQCPVVLAPAMNTMMWNHPATARHLRQLCEDFGASLPPRLADPQAICDAINALTDRLRIVDPVSKQLACGDTGMGGMAAVPEIVTAINDAVYRQDSMGGFGSLGD